MKLIDKLSKESPLGDCCSMLVLRIGADLWLLYVGLGLGDDPLDLERIWSKDIRGDAE